jgi:hypothetical protein
MKKILAIILFLVPLVIYGQKTFVKQTISGDSVILSRGGVELKPSVPSGDRIQFEDTFIAPISAALTDDTPTDTEIDTATGETPATAGNGYQKVIKDSNGSGLLYLVISDGTVWHYFKSTIAVN